MKTRHFIFAIALAVLASCSKNSLEPVAPQEQETTQELKVNMTVSCDGADTKTVKNSWVEGDKILVFFYPESFGGTFPDGPQHLTLTYKSSKWEAEFAPGIASKLLETSSGYLSAVYTQNQNEDFKYNSYWKCYDHTNKSGYYLYKNHVNYTIADTVLSADIQLSLHADSQIFMISGVNYEAGRYTLSCDRLLKSNLGSFYSTGFSTSNNAYGASVECSDNYGAASFYGLRESNAENVSMTYEFSLIDKVAKKRYVLTLYNKKCTSRFITLPALSEWSEAPSMYLSPKELYTYPGYLQGSVALYDSVNGVNISYKQVEWTMLGSASLAVPTVYDSRMYVKGLTFVSPSISQTLLASYEGETYKAEVYSSLGVTFNGRMQWLWAGNDSFSIKMKASDKGTAYFVYKKGQGANDWSYANGVSELACDCITFSMIGTSGFNYEVDAAAAKGIHPISLKINDLEFTTYVEIQE